MRSLYDPPKDLSGSAGAVIPDPDPDPGLGALVPVDRTLEPRQPHHPGAVAHLAPEGDALRDALALSELLTGMAQVTQDLQGRIEMITGLRYGQLRALQAVAGGAPTFSEVARRIAEHRDAARATVRSLVHLGLIHELPGGGPGGQATLVVSESGRARLDQIDALRVRLLAQLPPGVSDPLLALADGLATAGAEVGSP